MDAPIVQDVIRLNNCLIEINSKAYKVISRTYIDPMLKQGALLEAASFHFNLSRIYELINRIENMKYAKIENDEFPIKEFEKGIEVGGELTEEEIIAQGYKPLCEVEKPDGAEGFVYKDYGTCYVQIWKMPDEDIRPDEIWTSDSGIMPEFSDLQRLQKDIAMVNENINSLNLTSNEAFEVKEFYPEWSADSVEVKKGEKYQCDDLLWEVVQDHTTQANWKPSIYTASLWKVVNEEHEGTIDDAIPYTPPMELFVDKYYTQSDVLYKCTRNSEIPLSQNLSELVGLYVELVK